ncbi:MAG: hypothetical protein R3B06_26040 [Kofleriaceae bacterium]
MRSIVTGALALWGAACLTPPDNDIIQWSDDFEACDLCGWTTTGAVSRVTTYHPGEHALALGVGARATHPLAVDRAVSDGPNDYDSTDGNWLELSTDCAGPGALALRTVTTSADLPTPLALDLVLGSRGVGRFERHYLTVPALPPDAVRVRFVELTVATDRLPCRVDNLQLRISGGEYGY